jgi:hypothetical protein
VNVHGVVVGCAQYIMSVSAGVDTWVFSTPDLHDGQEPFLVWLQSMGNISDADVPKVISVSYGDDEVYDNTLRAPWRNFC